MNEKSNLGHFVEMGDEDGTPIFDLPLTGKKKNQKNKMEYKKKNMKEEEDLKISSFSFQIISQRKMYPLLSVTLSLLSLFLVREIGHHQAGPPKPRLFSLLGRVFLLMRVQDPGEEVCSLLGLVRVLDMHWKERKRREGVRRGKRDGIE